MPLYKPFPVQCLAGFPVLEANHFYLFILMQSSMPVFCVGDDRYWEQKTTLRTSQLNMDYYKADKTIKISITYIESL